MDERSELARDQREIAICMVVVAIDLFTARPEAMDEHALSQFVRDALATRLQAESLVLEFKSKRSGRNVVDAVAAMANTDGGIVLVGVDEDDHAEPLCGIAAREIDEVVQQLRALLPTAMPEAIPVALAGASERAVLLLRVDADQVDKPVVLDGRVLVRVPGATVGARRDEIVSLVERGSAQASSGIYGPPIDVAGIELWDGDLDRAPVEVRVHAHHVLPRHLVTRQWLGTSVMRSSLEALELSPVPGSMRSDHLRDHERHPTGWQLTELAARRARFRSELSPSGQRGRPQFASVAHVSVAGRAFDVVVSIGVWPREDGHSSLVDRIEHLRELLLGAAVTAEAVGKACADSMDAAYPLQPPTLSAWLGGEVGISPAVVDRRWTTEAKGRLTEVTDWRFDLLHPLSASLSDLDHIVRLWMIPLLFDLGAFGFEDDLDQMPLPKWSSRLTSEPRD